MTTQVIEREAAPPDTGTESPAEIDAQTGATPSQETGTEREAQTGQEPNDSGVAEIGDDGEDAEEAAITAKAEALAEKKLADLKRETAAKEAAEAEDRQMKERAKRYESLHVETVQATEAAIHKLPPLFDALGNPFEWTPAVLDSITQPTKAKNLTIWDDTKAALYTPIQNAVQKNISEERYADFAKEATGKQPDEYFEIFGEYRAPDTKWAKNLGLDDAKKLSPRLKADIANEIAEGVRKRIAKGVKAGDPGSGGTTSTSSGAQPSSMDEARSWHVSGRMTNAQFRAYQASQE